MYSINFREFSLHNALTIIGNVFTILRIIRAPLIVGIIAALLLSLPGQTREVYRIIAEDWANSGWYDNSDISEPVFQVLITFLFLLITTFGVWTCTNDIVLREQEHDEPKPLTLAKKLMLQSLYLIPTVLVPAGLALGIYLSTKETSLGDSLAEPLNKNLQNALLATLVTIAGATVIHFRYHRLATQVVGKGLMPMVCRSIRVLVTVAAACTATILVVFEPILFPQKVGTIFLLLNFILVIALISSFLTFTFDPYKIPIISALLLFAFSLSIFDINNNHTIPAKKLKKKSYIESLNNVPRKVPSIIGNNFLNMGDINKGAFFDWLKNRKDLDHYSSRDGQSPYPVFIIATAGGGMYAAAHAAIALSRLQDNCPNFSQHIFAISGVSGGSLGAAIFAGLTHNNDKVKNGKFEECHSGENGALELKARDFLKRDLLAPVVAATLYSDFAQRFWPNPHPFLDRARILDRSFEQAWRQIASSENNDFFEIPFADHWNPTEATPALILNTTDVNNGLRVVISPVSLDDELVKWVNTVGQRRARYSSLIDFYTYAGWLNQDGLSKDIKLSTAVGLSSRFPWVLPAGFVERRSPLGEMQIEDDQRRPNQQNSQQRYFIKNRLHLVDGGYFENSGAETAMDVINQISRYYENIPRKKRKCEDVIVQNANLRREDISDYNKKFTADKITLSDIYDISKRDQVEKCIDFLNHTNTLSDAGVPFGVKLHLILIDVDAPLAVRSSLSGSEILAPLIGLLSTRERRGRLANYRATKIRVPCVDELFLWPECDPWLVQQMRLDTRVLQLPLGWQISKRTIDSIARSVGLAERSGIPRAPTFVDGQQFPEGRPFLQKESDDTACAVQLILRGEAALDWQGWDWQSKNDRRPCRGKKNEAETEDFR